MCGIISNMEGPKDLTIDIIWCTQFQKVMISSQNNLTFMTSSMIDGLLKCYILSWIV